MVLLTMSGVIGVKTKSRDFGDVVDETSNGFEGRGGRRNGRKGFFVVLSYELYGDPGSVMEGRSNGFEGRGP